MKRETCLANKYNWVGSNCNSKSSKHGAWSDRLGCWNRSIGISWLWVKGSNSLLWVLWSQKNKVEMFSKILDGTASGMSLVKLSLWDLVQLPNCGLATCRRPLGGVYLYISRYIMERNYVPSDHPDFLLCQFIQKHQVSNCLICNSPGALFLASLTPSPQAHFLLAGPPLVPRALPLGGSTLSPKVHSPLQGPPLVPACTPPWRVHP